jgi:hypothetical protein
MAPPFNWTTKGQISQITISSYQKYTQNFTPVTNLQPNNFNNTPFFLGSNYTNLANNQTMNISGTVSQTNTIIQ